MMKSSRSSIPVTVVGGFLGAGKTTFLNHLLRSGTARYAVLVNDFGAVNIDASLIARHDGTTMTLTNGCVCCSIGAGFNETLGAVLDGPTAFDHIIIEASGVGEPWRIAEIALVEPQLRLSAVIVVADVSRIAQLVRDHRVGDTVRKQFKNADIVLLNKTDLVNDDTIARARAAIADVNIGLRVIETTRLTMPLLESITSSKSQFRADAVENITTDHEAKFVRWSYQRGGEFEREALEYALASLPVDLLRLKGACRLKGSKEPYILQLVERSWTLLPADTTDACDRDMIRDQDIILIGVGTSQLPNSAVLDSILDRALIVSQKAF